jgi:hypothetical protein
MEEEDDDGGGGIGEIPSGTIKLADSGNNTFTLTLTGGLTWKASDLSNPSFFLEFDGDVTAADDGYNAPISTPVLIDYTTTRTSDTVLTVVMSQLWSNYRPYFGSGKLKLRDLSDSVEPTSPSYGAQIVISYTEQAIIEQGVYHDIAEAEGKLTVAADSGSVSFNIPKYEDEE